MPIILQWSIIASALVYIVTNPIILKLSFTWSETKCWYTDNLLYYYIVSWNRMYLISRFFVWYSAVGLSRVWGILKVLTNEKRGGLSVVSFDRSPFKLFSLKFSNRLVQAPSCERHKTAPRTLFVSFANNNYFQTAV